ncbi:MAG TPA: DUF1992 domain-containing protein [Chthoniobacter sp.]|nr:DUF1992 domain-containing protein [Chthoniobacter sp.]
MNWTKLAESRIEEAMASGEFRDLPGQGKPLDLSDYFALPPSARAGAALLKNANVVPPEVQLLKEIGELEEALQHSGKRDRPQAAREFHGEDAKLTGLRGQLQEKRVALALAMERRRHREPRSLE